uniref:Uncharacterized protein n=1 Tax=Romanomermis culicivorax TaxID=13658 RepID=A0A915JWT5_ROMCU
VLENFAYSPGIVDVATGVVSAILKSGRRRRNGRRSFVYAANGRPVIAGAAGVSTTSVAQFFDTNVLEIFPSQVEDLFDRNVTLGGEPGHVLLEAEVDEPGFERQLKR